MSEYRCPSCGTSDPLGYVRCNQSSCPDGRDPRPQSDAEVDHLRAQVASLQKELAERTAERDEAVAKWEAADGMDGAVVHAIRQVLYAGEVPTATFIDDHVANAIVQRNEERSRADTLARRVEGLEKTLRAVKQWTQFELGSNASRQPWPRRLEAIDAALTGERP